MSHSVTSVEYTGSGLQWSVGSVGIFGISMNETRHSLTVLVVCNKQYFFDFELDGMSIGSQSKK